MSTHEYRGLIDGICALANIVDSQSMYEAANFEVNGVPFTLMDGSEIEEGSVLYFCDFGQVPNERRADILQVLLEANLAMYAKGAPFFSVNFFTKHIVLTGRIPIANTTPDALLEELAVRAQQAKQWHETYLLPGDAPATGAVLQKSVKAAGKEFSNRQFDLH